MNFCEKQSNRAIGRKGDDTGGSEVTWEGNGEIQATSGGR
jgi:hypothetical protein